MRTLKVKALRLYLRIENGKRIEQIRENANDRVIVAILTTLSAILVVDFVLLLVGAILS